MSKIFFNPKMVVSSNDSESRSAEKPRLFIELVKTQLPDLKIIESSPITKEDLKLAHSEFYVSDIFAQRMFNGFMNYNLDVPNSCLYTIGSMLDASLYSLKTNSIHCSPTSGFHHAGYESPEGYCTFNGLIVVSQILKQRGLISKIGILDLDFHYGNGTENIIKRLNLDYINHISLGKDFRKGDSSTDYLKAVKQALIEFKDCDLVLYQAGADLSINDPLGGILTDDEMVIRDELVFSLNKPIAWNLAGGYQLNYQKTLDIHLRTFKASMK